MVRRLAKRRRWIRRLHGRPHGLACVGHGDSPRLRPDRRARAQVTGRGRARARNGSAFHRSLCTMDRPGTILPRGRVSQSSQSAGQSAGASPASPDPSAAPRRSPDLQPGSAGPDGATGAATAGPSRRGQAAAAARPGRPARRRPRAAGPRPVPARRRNPRNPPPSPQSRGRRRRPGPARPGPRGRRRAGTVRRAGWPAAARAQAPSRRPRRRNPRRRTGTAAACRRGPAGPRRRCARPGCGGGTGWCCSASCCWSPRPPAVSAWYLWTRAADQYASTVGFSVRREEDELGHRAAGRASPTCRAPAPRTPTSSTSSSRARSWSPRSTTELDLRAHLVASPRTIRSSPTPPAPIEDLVDYWQRMVRISYDSGTGPDRGAGAGLRARGRHARSPRRSTTRARR